MTDALACFTRDPFHGFFDGRNGDRLIEPGSLLDTPAVRRWFDTFRAGLPESLYTYQLPLERRSGPESAVLGRYRFQLELAERSGADLVFGSRKEAYAWAASLPGARTFTPTLAPRFVEGGPSLVYDTVGSAGSIGDALALAREGGRIVLIGAAARVAADWTRVWYRQLSVAGVFAYGLVPHDGRRRDIYDVSLDLMQQDGFAELGMLTHVFDLEDYRAGLSAALDKDGHSSIKVAFRPGD